ncbi:MAG: hypothetical protein NC399_02850 [Muribaculum sp.]|nr:hypothetical protein [Muribaculum sp.]
MLNPDEIMDRLRDMGERFRWYYNHGQYDAAKHIYHDAHAAALTVGCSQAEMTELFGDAPYIGEDEQAQEGIFPAKWAEKASWECVVRHFTMDELHLHPRKPNILHDENDLVTRICTRRCPEGYTVDEILDVRPRRG